MREMFLGLMLQLDWRSISSLYEALAPSWRSRLFGNSTWYGKKIAPVALGRLRVGEVVTLRGEALSFRDFMAIWHLTAHSFDLIDMRRHSILSANYHYVTDIFVPGDVLPEQPTDLNYTAACFLPACAPFPFANSLWLAEFRTRAVKIFAPTRRGAQAICCYFSPETKEIVEFVVSEGGTSVLLADVQRGITLVRLSENRLEIRRTRLVLPFGERLRSVHLDEDTFVLRDSDWTYHEHRLDRKRNRLVSTRICRPTTLAPTTLVSEGREIQSREFSAYQASGEIGAFVYFPERESESPECLVTTEYCPVSNRVGRHPMMSSHILQLLPSPRRGDSEPYYLFVSNGMIVDFLPDHSRKSLFVVVLGWASELLFRKFPPSLARHRPADGCAMRFVQSEMTNLFVYQVRIADLRGYPTAVSAIPLFYIPSDRMMLEREVPPGVGTGQHSFGISFGYRMAGNIRGFANRRYLCITQSPVCVLFFSLFAERTSRPFSLGLTRPIRTRSLVTSEEMFYLAGIGTEDRVYASFKGKLNICRLCLDGSKLYQTEMATTTDEGNSSRAPTIATKRSLLHVKVPL